MVGLLLATALPVGFGLRGIVYQWTYVANVMLGPNEAHSGNPIPFLLTFIVGPICGFLGAATALLCAAISDWLFPRVADVSPLKSTEQSNARGFY